jgi:hypothetical protein
MTAIVIEPDSYHRSVGTARLFSTPDVSADRPGAVSASQTNEPDVSPDGVCVATFAAFANVLPGVRRSNSRRKSATACSPSTRARGVSYGRLTELQPVTQTMRRTGATNRRWKCPPFPAETKPGFTRLRGKDSNLDYLIQSRGRFRDRMHQNCSTTRFTRHCLTQNLG